MNFPYQKLATAMLLSISLLSTAHAANNGQDSASSPVKVDCTKGQSINKALKSDVAQLTIEVTGICNESVAIERDHVTLRGSDPLQDGIRADDTGQDAFTRTALRVLNAYQVGIENLQLTNGDYGLIVNHSGAIGLDNLLITGNQFGWFQRSSAAGAYSATITDNLEGGVLIRGASTWSCNNCTISDNPGSSESVLSAALTGRDASVLTLTDSVLSGDATGVALADASRLTVLGTSSIIAVPESTVAGYPCCAALDGAWDSNFNIGAGQTIEGPIFVYGGNLHIRTANQTIGAGWAGAINSLRATDARLVTGGSLQATDLSEFATLYLQDTAQVADLACDSGADAWCADPNVNIGGTSNCGQCPKP